jgi:hypothetical protein
MNRQPPVWNKDAAALLKQFIESPVGETFLANLTFIRPALLVGTPDPNAVALRASQVAGYEQCMNAIFTLMEPPTEEVQLSEAYPPLDDDSRWPDKGATANNNS